MKKVCKRDGTVVVFDRDKIFNALKKCSDNTEGADLSLEVIGEITDSVVSQLEGDPVKVEDIQDKVEAVLMENHLYAIAKSYIIYRNDRTRIREQNSDLMRRIKEKLLASNVENQNANLDERSFGGRVGSVSSEVLKQYALDNCMSEMARNNHLSNEIYIHDLDSYAVGNHNCLSVPIDDLLANGFTTRQVDIRPARSVNTAMQLVAVLFQIQSLMQFGGVSATHIDYSMVPYVRMSFFKHYVDGQKYFKDGGEDGYDETSSIENYPKKDSRTYQYALDMTEKEVYQACEGLFHNLNSLQSRSGNQLPFSSINFGTCTQPEGRMVSKALLNVSIKGLGKFHRTSIFPCQIFQLGKGINRKPGDPNYDLYQLALQSTAKRLYPNYANIDWSGNAGYDPNDPRTIFSTINRPVA